MNFFLLVKILNGCDLSIAWIACVARAIKVTGYSPD